MQRGLATAAMADEGHVADPIRGRVHGGSPLSRVLKTATLSGRWGRQPDDANPAHSARQDAGRAAGGGAGAEGAGGGGPRAGGAGGAARRGRVAPPAGPGRMRPGLLELARELG